MTVRACVDPSKFVYVTRRERAKAGFLIDEATGTETPLPRLVRWYKAGAAACGLSTGGSTPMVRNTRPRPRRERPGIQLLPDLPAVVPGDVDLGWYVAQARATDHWRIPTSPISIPSGFAGHPGAEYLHNLGLSPSPKWDGKKSPKGAKQDRPSYFWEWRNYHTFGTHTGPDAGILVLDIDEPAKFGNWVGKDGECAALAGAMVSFHQADRAGSGQGGVGPGQADLQVRSGCRSSPCPDRQGRPSGSPRRRGLLRQGRSGYPRVAPGRPEREYLIAGVLGPPPDWLIKDLAGRAAKNGQ